MTSMPSPPPPSAGGASGETKPVLVFLAQALVVALLLGSWPSARDLYPAAFRSGIQGVFASEADAAEAGVRVRPGEVRGDEVTDTFIEGLPAGGGEPEWRVAFSTLRIGYWPSAVLLALLLVTPMAARRRAWIALVGVLWLFVFAVVRLQLEIVRAGTELARGGASAEAEGSVLALRTASEVLGSNIVEIAAVLIVWVLLANPHRALRMGALGRLLGTPRSA
ncbi:MAG: hypothetical protein ACQGVC_23785 [Myxococcota bacterium]